MESAKNGANDKAALGGYHPRKRRVFVQRQVSSTLIVILLVRTQQIAQMPFAKNNDMVEAVASDRADQPLRVSILPGRAGRDRPIPNAHGANAPDEIAHKSERRASGCRPGAGRRQGTVLPIASAALLAAMSRVSSSLPPRRRAMTPHRERAGADAKSIRVSDIYVILCHFCTVARCDGSC